MTRRSRAREVALQVLYGDDVNPSRNLTVVDDFLTERLGHDPDLVEFARELVGGVRRNRKELDGWLAELARNWSLSRMAVLDRNVLRLGAFEIIFTKTPGQVVINEAVELAKRFGAKQSPQFVNGVLDRLMKEHQAGVRQGSEPSTS
jgi:N utilization substance protein B